MQPWGRGFESHRLHQLSVVLATRGEPTVRADDEWTEFFAARARARAASRLFDKLGEKQRNDRRGFSGENPVKLHKVHVRMPWHQEPTKDVA